MQVPDPARFADAVRHVQAYVRSESGSHGALMDAARCDPEGMTVSLVALGSVLLDIAAGALSVSPDDMLAKVVDSVAAMAAGRSTSPFDGAVHSRV